MMALLGLQDIASKFLLNVGMKLKEGTGALVGLQARSLTNDFVGLVMLPDNLIAFANHISLISLPGLLSCGSTITNIGEDH